MKVVKMLIVLLLGVLLASCGPNKTIEPNEILEPNESIEPNESTTSTQTPTPLPSPAPPSIPTPPTPTTIDFTGLQPVTYDYLGADYYAEYQAFCQAIFDREESFTFTSKEVGERIFTVFYSSNILCNLIPITFEELPDTTMTFNYQFDATAHDSYIEKARQAAQTAISTCIKPDYNDLQKAVALYGWVCQNIQYDYPAATDDMSDVSGYRALTEGWGICQSYDIVYNFFLQQFDIPSYSISSFTTQDQAHVWTAVKIADVWYHCDPTFENTENGGTTLKYFGMSDTRRIDSGCIYPFNTGIYPFNGDAPILTDERLAFMNEAIGYDITDQTVTVHTSDQSYIIDAQGNVTTEQ